jgi:hypothetical protein
VRVSVGAGPVRFYGLGALLWWLLGLALVGSLRLLHLAVCRPRTSGALLALTGLGWALLAHPVVTHAAILVGVEAVDGWALLGPVSWRRYGLPRLRGWWRSPWVYRRRWRTAMHVAELDRVDVDGKVQLPRLVRVRCTGTTDVVHVRGLLGQRFSDWETAAPMLAHVFGASGFAVNRGDDRRLTLELRRGRRGRSWNREGYELGADLER